MPEAKLASGQLLYNGHRYYDPKVGRYITSDPLGLWAGLNTYAYVRSNPLRWMDPLGLYIPQNTANCWVNMLTDDTYFTGKEHDNLGPESTWSITIPLTMDTPWSSAPDFMMWYYLTYHSQDYIRMGLFERLRSYDYVCKETDECGKPKYDSTRGYDTQSWWQKIGAGTFRWITREVVHQKPYPLPDPNNPNGPMGPLPTPIRIR